MINSLVDVYNTFQFVNLWVLIFVVLNIGSAVVIWLDKRKAQNGKNVYLNTRS